MNTTMQAKVAGMREFKAANPMVVQYGLWLYHGLQILGCRLDWRDREDAARIRILLNHHVVNAKPVPTALMEEAKQATLTIERECSSIEHARIGGLVRTMMG